MLFGMFLSDLISQVVSCRGDLIKQGPLYLMHFQYGLGKKVSNFVSFKWPTVTQWSTTLKIAYRIFFKPIAILAIFVV